MTNALVSLARSIRVKDSELQAQRIKAQILRRITTNEIALQKASSTTEHDARVEAWRRDSQVRTSWLCYLVRLETNRQSLGRKRGVQRLNRAQAGEKAINDAASTSWGNLRPVEKRAVELLSGESIKPKKNIIEKRAAHLAKKVKRQWLRSIPKAKPLYQAPRAGLSITQVISIAAPIIEEFVGHKIELPKREYSEESPAFKALKATVRECAHSGEKYTAARISQQLRRVRRVRPRAR